jgi:hypothetical protein
VVFQSGQLECAIVDPVLDYDPKSGRTATTNADRVIEFVRQKACTLSGYLKRTPTLATPVLIVPSGQVDMRAGDLPPAEENGTRYLKIPLSVL